MVVLGSDFAAHGSSLKESLRSKRRGGSAQASLSNGLLINLHHKIMQKSCTRSMESGHMIIKKKETAYDINFTDKNTFKSYHLNVGHADLQSSD